MSILPVKHFLARDNSRSGRTVLRGVLIFSLCFALLAGSVLSAGAYDLTKVKNKSFEKDSNGDGIPNGWTPFALAPGDKRVCNQSHAGSCSFKMVADGGNKQLYQETLYSSGPSGIVATLSIWTKGKDLVLESGFVRGYVTFDHTGGGTNYCFFNLPAGSSSWTERQASCAATAGFDSMTIYLWANGAASGKVWFDKVKLTAVAP